MSSSTSPSSFASAGGHQVPFAWSHQTRGLHQLQAQQARPWEGPLQPVGLPMAESAHPLHYTRLVPQGENSIYKRKQRRLFVHSLHPGCLVHWHLPAWVYSGWPGDCYKYIADDDVGIVVLVLFTVALVPSPRRGGRLLKLRARNCSMSLCTVWTGK